MGKDFLDDIVTTSPACMVIQSAPPDAEPWVVGCMNSVRQWATPAGYEYRFLDDALFEKLPDNLREKLAQRTPVMADLARLLWIRELHEAACEWVLWLDADTLIVDPAFRLSTHVHTTFGEELWLQERRQGGYEVRRQPHNAFILLHRDSPVRDFLIFAVESVLQRIDPGHIPPQVAGPKLLKALHNIVAFDLEPAAGALSPLLQTVLVQGDTAAVLKSWPGQTLAMVNLCSSLPVAGGVREGLVENPEAVAAALSRR